MCKDYVESRKVQKTQTSCQWGLTGDTIAQEWARIVREYIP